MTLKIMTRIRCDEPGCNVIIERISRDKSQPFTLWDNARQFGWTKLKAAHNLNDEHYCPDHSDYVEIESDGTWPGRIKITPREE